MRLAHLCVDVQNLFAENTDWHAPWLKRTLPAIEALVERSPERTIFTRFIPAENAETASGSWKDYYRRWPSMTRDALSAELLRVVPALDRFCPPARVLDKQTYSPWLGTNLNSILQTEAVDTLLISGGETDVCVLATVLGAIDLGYHVIIATDAVFGSADQTHDAALTLYASRFGQQLTASETQHVLDNWTHWNL
nr:cysteine hydrolase [uncultured Devosia sp.]